MNVLGVDPSSYSSGYSVTVDGEPVLVKVQVHQPTRNKNDRETTAGNMCRFLAVLFEVHRQYKIDVVSVEQVSMTMGMHTVRMLAYSEAVPIMFSHGVDARLLMMQATHARSVVLGKGTLSKEAATELVVARFPDIDWPENTDLLGDATDSLVLSIAGYKDAKELINAGAWDSI